MGCGAGFPEYAEAMPQDICGRFKEDWSRNEYHGQELADDRTVDVGAKMSQSLLCAQTVRQLLLCQGHMDVSA